jgi:hypothetical protein
MADEWKLVTSDMMTLRDYPCGLSAGDTLCLLSDLVIRDHKGRPTGQVRVAGETSTVLTGNPAEPKVIWLRWADGEVHTWDDTVFDSFQTLKKKL